MDDNNMNDEFSLENEVKKINKEFGYTDYHDDKCYYCGTRLGTNLACFCHQRMNATIAHSKLVLVKSDKE